MRRPLSFSTAKRLPSQSGKYTASPSTVGVAETSLPVVNIHLGLRPLTLARLIECSAGWFHVLLKFCPAIRHCEDWPSGERLCAPRAEAERRTVANTIVGNDQFLRRKPSNIQTFIDFSLLIFWSNLVAPMIWHNRFTANDNSQLLLVQVRPL